MPHAEFLDAVRRHVRQVFAELGAPTPLEMREAILLSHDHYCGRRFTAGDWQAIWFIEEDQLKFYSRGGVVERVVSASVELQKQRLVPATSAVPLAPAAEKRRAA